MFAARGAECYHQEDEGGGHLFTNIKDVQEQKEIGRWTRNEYTCGDRETKKQLSFLQKKKHLS